MPFYENFVFQKKSIKDYPAERMSNSDGGFNMKRLDECNMINYYGYNHGKL